MAQKFNLNSRAKVFKKFSGITSRNKREISLYDHNNRDINNKPTLIIKLYKPSYFLNIFDFKSDKIDANIKALFFLNFMRTSVLHSTKNPLKRKKGRAATPALLRRPQQG